MKRPLITVIVPIYNVEKYLPKCIDSIINQTYKNLEIILVNDGSTDSCLEICNRYKLKDSRIIVIDKKNGGLSSARNEGLKKARGEYISFIDSDDWIDKDMYKILVDFIFKNDLDIAECGFRRVYEDGKIVNGTESEREIVCNNIDTLNYFLDSKNFFYPMVWNKLFHKKLLKNNKFKEGYIHEDGFFTYRTYYEANKIGYIDIDKYNYLQQRKGSIMNEEFSEKRLVILEAFKERTDYFESKKQISLKEKSFKQYIETLLSFYCQASRSSDFNVEKKRYLEEEILKNRRLVKINKHGMKTKLKTLLFSLNKFLYVKIVNYKCYGGWNYVN